MTISDNISKATSGSQQGPSSNLMDEITSQRLTNCPMMPARPGDPHYVAQTKWDAEQGMLDLNSGNFTQGECKINQSIQDLSKEQTLISGAQSGGKTAAQDLLNGDSQCAQQQLSKTVDDMKGNGFTAAAREDYQDAEKALKSGDSWKAQEDIAKAEQVLDNRSKKVDDASKDLTEGLKDFNSGQFQQGEKDMRDATHDLTIPPIWGHFPGGIQPGGPIVWGGDPPHFPIGIGDPEPIKFEGHFPKGHIQNPMGIHSTNPYLMDAAATKNSGPPAGSTQA